MIKEFTSSIAQDVPDFAVKPRKVRKTPSISTLRRWSFDGVAQATDGCKVETDGQCPHGAKSWLLVLGMI